MKTSESPDFAEVGESLDAPPTVENRIGTTPDNGQTGSAVDFDEVLKETGMTSSRAFHNLEGDRMEIYKLTTIARSSEATPMSEHVDKQIVVKYFYSHAVQILDEKTGELEIVPRTVLIQPNMKAFYAVSEGIADSLKILTECMGRNFGDGIKVKVKQTKTRKRRDLLTFEPV